jgi:N-acetylglucosamine malate deacetylase 2
VSVKGERTSSLIDQIVSSRPVAVSIVAVVAHPDDETIGMGARLGRLQNLSLVHVTDGSPKNMGRARSLGFDSAEAYSRVRFNELRDALALLGVRPVRHLMLGFSDGETAMHIAELTEKIEAAIAGATAVITHAYEGGHPDHDVCALVTQLACARLAASGGAAPRRLEFGGYFSRGGQLVSNCFWPDGAYPASVVRLSWRERRRKRKAMCAFRTQAFILKDMPPWQEAYRRAPVYDFLRPPPPGVWYYDCHDWPLKGETWLRHVRERFGEDELGALNRRLAETDF